MTNTIPYTVAPRPSTFNLIVFTMAYAQGAYQGQRVGQAFMNEFQYSEGPGFEGLWEEKNDAAAWAHIARIVDDYQLTA